MPEESRRAVPSHDISTKFEWYENEPNKHVALKMRVLIWKVALSRKAGAGILLVVLTFVHILV